MVLAALAGLANVWMFGNAVLWLALDAVLHEQQEKEDEQFQ